MFCRAFACLAFLAITTVSSAATVPVLTVLSPSYAISSGQNGASYYGGSPTHIVAYAASPDCASGISGIQIYTADGVLAYSTYSSYVDVQLPLSPNIYQLDIKVWDNCGGVADDGIQDWVPIGSTGQITVDQPIANFTYAPPGTGALAGGNIGIVATATTTCAKGVSAVGADDAPGHRVAGENGKQLVATITLQPGTTKLVIEEWDNCGGASTVTVPVTVASGGFAGPTMHAFIPDASTGTLQTFFGPNAPTPNCALNAVLGNPSPAHYDPIAVAYVNPYVLVLNQDTQDVSIYTQDEYVEGSLTQVPGSPFPLHLPAGYTPTGLVVPSAASPLNIFVSNKSTSGSSSGSIGEYTYNQSTGQFSETQGSPVMLKGDAQPTSIYVGPVSGNSVGGVVFTTNGSSISVLKGSNTPTVTEVGGSPFVVTGRYGPNAGILDATVAYSGQTNGFIYTANAEGTISGFAINDEFQLVQVAGSPFMNPDDTKGSTGNPVSVAYGQLTNSDLYALNAGAEDIGVFSVNQSSGVLTYARSEQKGRVLATTQDRMRYLVSGDVSCLTTSNGYSMSVGTKTGVTTLEPGSPFLGAGVYPDIWLGLY
jgi:hypothetical protein